MQLFPPPFLSYTKQSTPERPPLRTAEKFQNSIKGTYPLPIKGSSGFIIWPKLMSLKIIGDANPRFARATANVEGGWRVNLWGGGVAHRLSIIYQTTVPNLPDSAWTCVGRFWEIFNSIGVLGRKLLFASYWLLNYLSLCVPIFRDKSILGYKLGNRKGTY